MKTEDIVTRFRFAAAAEFNYGEYVEVSQAARNSAEINNFPIIKIAILRNITIEPILPILTGEAIRCGFRAEFYLSDFDAAPKDILQIDSALYQFEPDLIILMQWLEGLNPDLVNCFGKLTDDDVVGHIADIISRQQSLLSALRRSTNAIILLNNFPLLPYPNLGILDTNTQFGQTHTVLEINAQMRNFVMASSNMYIVDLMRHMATIGWSCGFDERFWHIARAPLAKSALLAFGRECGTFIRSLRGRTRKCLVLDCDNTLWGGVVGEDGIEGIKIGRSAPGSFYRRFQEEILSLHSRGILLALCSKNNLEDVMQVFREHPEMILREHHFVAFAVNWEDKATNLRRIARELNIGIDSLVFVDDNIFEVDLVRSQLPDVATIHLPSSPSSYWTMVVKHGVFDTLTRSKEDGARSEMYRAARERERLRSDAADLGAYFADLQVVVEVRAASEFDLPRVAQLTQKTNQFNLTTKRYSLGDVKALYDKGDVMILIAIAKDRISDLGIVGVAILMFARFATEIDSFLVSCRALGRGVEDAFLSGTVALARAAKQSEIIGAYVPTEKNIQCADFYSRHGFAKVTGDIGDASSKWVLTADRECPVTPAWINLQKGD